MFKLFPNFFFEFVSCFIYAAKHRQVGKHLSNIFNELFFRSYRKNLPNEISNLKKLPSLSNFNNDFNYLIKNNISSEQKFQTATLAGKIHELDIANIWEIKWTDIEEIYSLHRFGWLLLDLKKNRSMPVKKFSIYSILNWIENNNNINKVGWDSYSISERVSNWVIFLQSYDGINNLQKKYIENSIKFQLSVLMQNLEFRGKATNNHIINNGRALYLGGIYTNDKTYRYSGSTILKDSADLMFSKSGFLREASSHYQILLARTYLEVLWFARESNDPDFEMSMHSQIKNISEAACFFLQEKDMPIFGDISPDFPIGFHSGIGVISEILFKNKNNALVPNADGWHSFFKLSKNKNISRSQFLGLINYEDAGYCCYRNNNFSLYIFTNPKGYVSSWSHGHADVGNIVLYLKGKPLLISTGRMNYKNDAVSQYGRSIRSHNSVEIDSREPIIVHGLNAYPELMLDDYYKNKSEINFIHSKNNFIIEIIHNGYKRLFNNIKVKRTIEISENIITVKDKVYDLKTHSIKSFFHFSPEVSIYDNKNDMFKMSLGDDFFDFRVSSTSKFSSQTHTNEECYGVYFPQYGKKKPTSTIIFSQNDEYSVSNKYVFEIKN